MMMDRGSMDYHLLTSVTSDLTRYALYPDTTSLNPSLLDSFDTKLFPRETATAPPRGGTSEGDPARSGLLPPGPLPPISTVAGSFGYHDMARRNYAELMQLNDEFLSISLITDLYGLIVALLLVLI